MYFASDKGRAIMGKCTVYHIDAFSAVPNMGNPAGVVVNAEGLDETAMQHIAKAVGFNETVFVTPSADADYRYRFFTPGHEMPLCGHATVAASFHLCQVGGKTREFTIETRAGVLPIRYDAAQGLVTMRHAEPQFRDFSGSREELARVMGIGAERISRDLPVVYGSTGSWTLLVPVDASGTLDVMRPDTQSFPGVLREMPRVSIHPFAAAPGAADHDFVARHFSSPYSGTVEDPVTGTASGVMGAYAMTHLHPEAREKRFVVAQGASVGRDGRVTVDVLRTEEGLQVSISGAASLVGEMAIEY